MKIFEIWKHGLPDRFVVYVDEKINDYWIEIGSLHKDGSLLLCGVGQNRIFHSTREAIQIIKRFYPGVVKNDKMKSRYGDRASLVYVYTL